MENEHCVIVGASHAGVSMALQLRREGWAGLITLIGEENELPYHRPPLSKDFLGGTKTLDTMRLRPEKAYADNSIDLKLGVAVTSIDRQMQTLRLDSGEVISYSKLALCIGASVIKLPTKPELGGVYTIRNVDDVLPIIEAIKTAKSAVIIGAGYIGLEAAAVLSQAGIEVNVLEMADRILARVTSTTMSEYMQSLHESHGVKIHTQTQVLELVGNQKVESVLCSNDKTFAADIVIVGIGVRPNTRLADEAGLTVDNGIVVDSQCRTSDENIYAAGDCCNHHSFLYDCSLRLESVQNANDQARIAAANICGGSKDYDAVPWFWSDQYDIKLQMVGLSNGFDKVVIRGDASDALHEGFALFYFRDSVLIAADCVSRPKEFMASKQLVMKKSKIDPAILMDEGIEPASFLL